MEKAFQTRFTAIILLIVGLILLALELYASWIFLMLPKAIAGSTIAILLISYLLSRLKISVGIERSLLIWGLILISIATAICIATVVNVIVSYPTIPPQIIPIAILTIAILTGSIFVITNQQQYYLLIVIAEIAFIALFSDISINLLQYYTLNILLLTAVTIFLLKAVVRYCWKRASFSHLLHLLKEFVIDPLSNAFSRLLFTTPFMVVLISILAIQNVISFSSFNALIKLGFVLLGSIYIVIAIIRKLYKESCVSKLIATDIATIIAIVISISLTYPLGLYSGWIEFPIERLRDLKPMLVSSFILIAFFVHTPMICLITNRDKCKELNKTD